MTQTDIDDLIDEHEQIDARLHLRLRLIAAFDAGAMSMLERVRGKPQQETITQAVDRIEAMTTEQLIRKFDPMVQ